MPLGPPLNARGSGWFRRDWLDSHRSALPLQTRLGNAACDRQMVGEARFAEPSRRLGAPLRAVISGYLYCQPFGYCGEQGECSGCSDDFSVGAEFGVPVRYMARAQQRLAAVSRCRCMCVADLDGEVACPRLRPPAGAERM